MRRGAQKHTLILDCCRVRTDERLHTKAAMTLDFAENRDQTLNASACRHYFDKAISDCNVGMVVMNSCSINETASEYELRGGYYTSSLVDAANGWARETLGTIKLATEFAILSTQECHNIAANQVRRLSGGRQTPDFESPRVGKKFPFSVVA